MARSGNLLILTSNTVTNKANVKKITVSIPYDILKILTDERIRNQVKNLKKTANSELLCEAYYMPTDEDLSKDNSPYNHSLMQNNK